MMSPNPHSSLTENEPFLGVVCGLQSEATAVRRGLTNFHGTRVEVGVSGANADRAAGIAADFQKAGCVGLLSVGVSGGLDPSLRPGDLVVTGDVYAAPEGTARMASNGREPGPFQLIEHAHRDLSRLAKTPSNAQAAPILGVDKIIQSADEKAKLFAQTGAIAVDMESHAVARIAARHGLAFLAIRGIADPASRALPPAAMNAVAPDGSTRIMTTLLECAKAPGQFPALLQLGSESNKALATLRRDLSVLISGFFLRLDL